MVYTVHTAFMYYTSQPKSITLRNDFKFGH